MTLVSVTLASREVPVMVGLRLFLPEVWTGDPDRMARARVPEDRQTVLSKPEIAIGEIDRVRAAGVRFGCVLADAGYGSSGPFRQALSARGLSWAVGCRDARTSIRQMSAWSFPTPGAVGAANITSPTAWPFPPKRCWTPGNGERSAGGGAPKAS